MNKCEITRDLIPGYADEVLSPSGREYVETHTAECADCKAALDMARETVVTRNTEENAAAKNPFKKVNVKKALILSLSTIFALAIVGFGIFAVHDACNGYYNLNQLFGHSWTTELIGKGLDENTAELAGYGFSELTKVASSWYESDGIKAKVTAVLRSDDDRYWYVYIKGCPTGVGTYEIDEFIFKGEDENGSMPIINSEGELFCACRNDLYGYSWGTDDPISEGGFGTYRELVVKDGDKERFISERSKLYIECWTAEQAAEMAKTDWELQVEWIEAMREDTLKLLRGEFEVSEEAIEKWISFAG